MPPDDTALAYEFLRMSASLFVLYWKDVSWNPLPPYVSGGCQERRFRVTATFGANSDDVVWEPAGLLLVNSRSRELCVIIHANVAQFLCDIPSDLPLCGGRERVPSVREVLHEILCKITASHAKDGVMQSVTVVDGQCVRHVRSTFWVAMNMAGTLKPG